MIPGGNSLAFDIISFGYRYKVGTCNVDERIAPVVKQLLPLANHTKEFIVEYQYLNLRSKLHDGSKFLKRHLEASVADNGYNGAFGSSIPGADSCRKSESHCTQTSGGDIAFRLVKFRIAT